MEELVRELLKGLGEDTARPGLEKTPRRVAKALRELTSGIGKDGRAELESAVFESDSEGMVVCRDVHFVSLCEHHMLPFIGQACIAYLPRGKLVGISKLVRVTEIFARRLQVQENLGQQILDAIDATLSPAGSMVHLKALHLCMVARGVRQEQATMETLHVSGAFKEDPGLPWSVLRGKA